MSNTEALAARPIPGYSRYVEALRRGVRVLVVLAALLALPAASAQAAAVEPPQIVAPGD